VFDIGLRFLCTLIGQGRGLALAIQDPDALRVRTRFATHLILSTCMQQVVK